MPNNQDFNVDRNTVKSPGDSIGTAIILAAGMGVRLKERGKLTSKEPKRLGEKSIIEDSVLRMLGVCSDSSSTDARRSQPRRNQLAITKPRQLSC